MQEPEEFRAATRRLHELNAKAASLKVRISALRLRLPHGGAMHGLPRAPDGAAHERQEYLVSMDQR
jgi:hypothetical protein